MYQKCLNQGALKAREAKRANLLNFHVKSDDNMADCGFLGIFMTRKVLGSFPEV